jgi:hypothetical protein
MVELGAATPAGPGGPTSLQELFPGGLGRLVDLSARRVRRFSAGRHDPGCRSPGANPEATGTAPVGILSGAAKMLAGEGVERNLGWPLACGPPSECGRQQTLSRLRRLGERRMAGRTASFEKPPGWRFWMVQI